MKKFIIKLILFSLPLLIPVVMYFIIDPFKVIRGDINTYNIDKEYQVETNRDYQTTELFLTNHKTYAYNSFIFGSSRSYFYKANQWNRFIDGSVFHFNSSGETIFGINKKVNYLNEANVEIKNALVVLDVDVLGTVRNNKGHLFIKHPLTSKESKLLFHIKMFLGFFPKAVIPFTDFYITNRIKPYMKEYGISNKSISINLLNNELCLKEEDQKIKADSIFYFKAKGEVFYERSENQIYSKPTIFKEQIDLLNEIKEVFSKQHTDYKIIISPLYDQKKIAPSDLIELQRIFGKDRVYDFSGINKYTIDFTNFYEPSHYRPIVASQILDSIYSNKK